MVESDLQAEALEPPKTKFEAVLRNPWVDRTFGLLLVLVHGEKLGALLRANTADLASMAYTANFLLLGLIVMTRRPARRFDINLFTWFCGVAASGLGVALNLMHFDGEHRIGSFEVSQVLAIVGTVFMTASRLSLGRSFALLPADRGIKTGGTYRLVRHPIYSSFLFSAAAVVMSRYSLPLVAMVVASLILMVLRAQQEERLLMLDPGYRAYAERVKYRFVPFVY